MVLDADGGERELLKDSLFPPRPRPSPGLARVGGVQGEGGAKFVHLAGIEALSAQPFKNLLAQFQLARAPKKALP